MNLSTDTLNQLNGIKNSVDELKRKDYSFKKLKEITSDFSEESNTLNINLLFYEYKNTSALKIENKVIDFLVSILKGNEVIQVKLLLRDLECIYIYRSITTISKNFKYCNAMVNTRVLKNK